MDPMMLIMIVGGGLVFLLLVAGLVVTATSEQALVDQRIGRYLEEDVKDAGGGERQSPIGDWLNERMEGSSLGERIARDLARADLKLKPAEFLSAMVIFAFGAAFIAWYIGGRSMISALIGVVIGMSAPRVYVARQKGQRLQHFNDQLADMLHLMVNGLRAGYSVMQAMEAVSKEMPAPICDEFRRVVQEMQIGLPMERALYNLMRRIPSDDLDLVITAINVQREVGGNLAEILETISYTIRERVRIQGEIRVLTTQVMYSGRFLAMLPVLLSIALWFMNREYMMEFFNPETRLVGIGALTLGALMIMAGYFVMTRIGKIDI